MLTLAPQTLGSRLQGEREIRGFTLEQISASTKIPIPLLEGLERDDLSRWPKGIYRRAFFRAYVTALGVSPEPLTSEFARLFPDEPLSEARATTCAAPSSPVIPANEAAASVTTAHRVWRPVVVALVEVAAIVAVGSLAAWSSGISLLAGSGAVALVYYPLMRATAGRIRRPSRATSARTAPLNLTLESEGVATTAAPRAITRYRAVRRIQSGVASSRVRLGQLHAHVDARWRPGASRIVTRTNNVVSRAGGGTWRVLARGANATGRASATVLGWTNVVVRRAGVATGRAAGHAARHTTRVSSRVLAAANLAFWQIVRAAAEQAQLLAARQLNRTRE